MEVSCWRGGRRTRGRLPAAEWRRLDSLFLCASRGRRATDRPYRRLLILSVGGKTRRTKRRVGVAPPLTESRITHYTPPSSSLRTRLTQHPAPLACALYSPNHQSHGNHRSRDREGWQPPEVDQRHRERRHESTADDGARDDLPIAVASHDVRLPQGVDHVHHHEAASEHALGFAELGNGMLEPVLREDVPPDDQCHEELQPIAATASMISGPMFAPIAPNDNV